MLNSLFLFCLLCNISFLLSKKDNWKTNALIENAWKISISFYYLFTNAIYHIFVVLLRNWECMNEIFMIWRTSSMFQRNRKCIFYLVQNSILFVLLSFYWFPRFFKELKFCTESAYLLPTLMFEKMRSTFLQVCHPTKLKSLFLRLHT